MDGTNFFNGVLTTQVDLKRAQTSAATEIRRSRYEIASGGIISGGEVSVNTTNSDRIDIQPFEGFTPRGDYVTSTLANNNYPLADYAVGVNNYVLAVYTENLTGNRPHESNGQLYPTKIEGSYRLVILSESDYLNPSVLTPSDNNLQNDAKDRALVLAVVTANGSGSTLTAANIQSPISFNSLLYSNPVIFPDMLGVDVKYVDPSTSTGTGTLEYQYVSPNYQLRWTSPGGSPGAWQSWAVDGEKAVTDGTGKYLNVYMAVSQMDTSGSFPYTQSVGIVDLYYQNIPRNTAEDWLHRKMRGTGVVSEKNPHGTSVNDLTDETIFLLDEHQDIMHCNGIWKGSLSTTLSSFVIPSSPYDSLGINAPSNTDAYYINGVKSSTLTNTTFSFSTAFAGLSSSLWECYVTDQAETHVSKKAEYPLVRNVRGTWLVDMSTSYVAGTYELKVRVETISSVKFYFSWDGGTEVLVYEGDADRVIRLFSLDGISYVDLWVRSSASGSSDAFLPSSAGTYTDSIIVYDSVSWLNNMHIASVPYWYDSLLLQTFIGYAPYSVSRAIVDKRTWGNLCEMNVNDKFLQDYFYHPNKELSRSGILRYRDDYNYPGSFNYSSTGFNLNIKGGHCYCRGQRLSVPGRILTLAANKHYMAYVNSDGILSFLNITDDFSGDRVVALRYLLGNAAYREVISDSYHANVESSGTPERGVPLYYVETDSSTVSYLLDVSRNINGVSDPWSVGRGEGLSFATLEAAFMYASLYTGTSLVVTVSGTVISFEILEQPSNVVVKGSSPSSIVYISSGWSGVTTGVWLLEANCAVRDLNILTFSEYLFGLNSGIVIDNCNITTLNNTILFGNNSAPSVDDVKILNNKFSIQGLMSPGAFSSVSGWVISGNTIRSSSQGFTADKFGLIGGSFEDSVISNNVLFPASVGSGRIAGGISLIGSSMVAVSGNTIAIGAGNGSVVEPGIYIENCDSVSISANIIYRNSSNTNKASIGIYLNNVGIIKNLTINGNSIKGVNTGVFGYSGINVEGLIISSNSFSTLYSSAIDCTLDDYRGITISSNVIEDISYSSSSLPLIKDVRGISLELAGGTYCKNLSIINNSITNVFSSGSTPPVGILVSSLVGSFTISGITIKGNTIDELTYTGSSKSNSLSGVKVGISSDNVYSLSITDNIMSYFSSTYAVYGVSVSHGVVSSDDDTVVISRNNISNFYMGDTQSDSVRSAGISATGSVFSNKILISDNKLDLTSSAVYSGSDTYVPRGISVSTFKGFSVNENMVRYLENTNPYYTYVGYGIYLSVSSGSGTVDGNMIEVPRGHGIYVSTSQNINVIKNDVKSSIYGITLSASCGFSKVDKNVVGLIPQENVPSAGLNNIFNNSYCISILSRGVFSVIGNRTYTTDEVNRIGNNLPSTLYRAYHMELVINDYGDNINSYKVDENLIDLRSQGNNSNSYSMTGIIMYQGGNYTSNANHLISFVGNTIEGGRHNSLAQVSLPVTYSSSYEPAVVRFGDLAQGTDYYAQYYTAANTSVHGTFSPSSLLKSYICADSPSQIVSTGTNFDQGLRVIEAILW